MAPIFKGPPYFVTNKNSKLTREYLCDYQKNYLLFKGKILQSYLIFKNAPSQNSFNAFLKANGSSLRIMISEIEEAVTHYFQSTRLDTSNKPKVGTFIYDENKNFLKFLKKNEVIKTANEYSSLSDVSKGFPYLSNNLPRDFQEGKVIHKAIDKAKCDIYKLRIRDKRFCSNTLRAIAPNYLNRDEQWNAIVKKVNSKKRFYKSHLMVPIGFDKWVAKGIFEDNHIMSTDDDCTLYGCLAVDHVSANYFDSTPIQNASKEFTMDNEDLNAMYFFADLLSIPMAMSKYYERQVEMMPTSQKFYENTENK